jgi:ribosomal protein L24
LYVKGVNEVKRAMKGKGFVKKHLPIHVSNVMYYLEAEKKPTRIKITTDKK